VDRITLIDARPDAVTAANIDARIPELVFATKTGEVFAAAIPALSGDDDTLVAPRLVAAPGAKVTAIGKAGPETLLVARQGGALLRLTRDSQGRFETTETLSPFGEMSAVQIEALSGQAVALRTESGPFGVLTLSGAAERSIHPARATSAAGLAVARTGRRYVYATKDRIICVEAGRPELQMVSQDRSDLEFVNVAISREGDRLAGLTGAGSELRIWNLPEPGESGASSRDTIEIDQAFKSQLFVSNDQTLTFLPGRRLCVTGGNGVVLIDLPEGDDPKVAPLRRYEALSSIAAVAPLGKRVLLLDRRAARLLIAAPDRSDRSRELTLPAIGHCVVALPGDEEALVGVEGAVLRVDLATGSVLKTIAMPDAEAPVRTLALLPVGEGIFAAAQGSLIVMAQLEVGVFAERSIDDNARALRVAEGRVHWVGAQAHGSLTLPDYTGRATGDARIRSATGFELRGGRLRRAAGGLLAEPVESSGEDTR
jgi:hypothetical protein